MFQKINLSAFLLGVFFISIFSGCNNSSDNQDSKTLILAHAMHATHPVTLGMNYMAERLEEISEGKLTVKMYPSGQLGNERALIELVQLGTIAITKVSGASLENIVPPIRVFSLPYLFEDTDHYYEIVNGEIGEALLESGLDYKLKGLAYYDAGWRSFYTTNRPINSPDDIRGMKIRVQPSGMAIRLVRILGGSPTPLAYGELYTAFQGGVVDGAENNSPSFYSSRHYEVTNYYSINEHTAVPDFLMMNSDIWEELSEEQKEWLTQAVDESVDYQHQLWVESEEESMRVVQEAGVEVIYPDKEPFRERVQPIYEEFRNNHPDLYENWVTRIRQYQN